MHHINLIRWLKDVVEGLVGTTPVVRIKVVREPNFKRVHISFHVHVRWNQERPPRWFQLPQWVSGVNDQNWHRPV